MPKKMLDRTIWKRFMLRYSLLMILGLIITIVIIPYVKEGAEAWNMGLLLLGGLGLFGGFFGLAVSLFFHLWHSKASE